MERNLVSMAVMMLIASAVSAEDITSEILAPAKSADKMVFIPSVALGYRSFEFTPAYIHGIKKGKVNDTFLNLNTAATLVYKKTYFNLSYDTNVTGGEIDAGESIVGHASIDRDDLAATIGVNVFKNAALFFGYKFGNTTIIPDPTADNQEIRLSGYEHDYEESGFFVGGSYSLNFKNTGSLIGSIAYAQMNGEYTDNAYTAAFNATGDTDGFSYGARWVGFLSDDFDYFVDLKLNRYEFEGRDGTFGRLSSAQNISTLSIGLAFYPNF